MVRSKQANPGLLLAALVVAMVAGCGDGGESAAPVTYTGNFSGSASAGVVPPGCEPPHFANLTGRGTFTFTPSPGGGFTIEGSLSLTSAEPQCVPGVPTVNCSGSAKGGEATFTCPLGIPVTAPLDGSGTYDQTSFSERWRVMSGSWVGSGTFSLTASPR